jgi:plastocyanin
VKTRHPAAALLVVVATAMLLASCGGKTSANGRTSPNGGSPTASSGASSNAVRISNFKFVPTSLTAKRGARVTVTNDDSAAHTATADDGHSFDTGSLNQGASQAISVAKPGRYAYHCTIHPFMHGTLVVN